MAYRLLSGDDDDWNQSVDGIPHFRHTDIGEHYFGYFSSAVLRNNQIVGYKSQVEVADGFVFCGLYDGHGDGVHESTYFFNKLHPKFQSLVQERKTISKYTILDAFIDTENGFQRKFRDNENIAACGSYCLVGILKGRTLHYANLGDSRAVLGYMGYGGCISAEQLTQDHDGVVVKGMNRMQRVNGLLTLSSSIGDGILQGDNLAIQSGNLHIPGKPHRPLQNAVPSVQARELCHADRFVIFASNGLWKLLLNHEAAQLVYYGPREEAAKRLVTKALKRRANQLGWTSDQLKERLNNEWPNEIDEIIVIVLFVDYKFLDAGKAVPAHSERMSVDQVAPLLPADNPADNPEENPADDPADNLADNPEDNPADNPAENPADNPEDNPADNPGVFSYEDSLRFTYF